jgi:hypothetical protein
MHDEPCVEPCIGGGGFKVTRQAVGRDSTLQTAQYAAARAHDERWVDESPWSTEIPEYAAFVLWSWLLHGKTVGNLSIFRHTQCVYPFIEFFIDVVCTLCKSTVVHRILAIHRMMITCASALPLRTRKKKIDFMNIAYAVSWWIDACAIILEKTRTPRFSAPYFIKVN